MSVARKEILSSSSLLWILSLGFLYVVFTLFLLNYRLVFATLVNSSSFIAKTMLLLTLLGGVLTAFTPLDSAIFLLNALLVGTNLLLIVKTLYYLGHQGKVQVTIGGATLLGLISTGCSSCGFSVLSILGLSTSLSFLPFHGLELHMLSLLFLSFSAFYMLKKLRESIYCKI